MANYEKIISNLEHAERHCRQAEEAMVPISRVKQVDAYLLGLLQATRLILADAKRATASAVKARALQPKQLKSKLL